MTSTALRPASSPRISPRVRAAVDARVRKGLSIERAAREAGLSREGFAKALRRPAVAALVDETRGRMVAEFETLRASARALALEAARDLLTNGSEATKLRVIGILLAAEKPASNAVQFNVGAAAGGGGYEFARPGQRVVRLDGGDAVEIVD